MLWLLLSLATPSLALHPQDPSSFSLPLYLGIISSAVGFVVLTVLYITLCAGKSKTSDEEEDPFKHIPITDDEIGALYLRQGTDVVVGEQVESIWSVLYEGTFVQKNKKVQLKRIGIPTKLFYYETNILKTIRHPNVIQTYGLFKDSVGDHFVVSEKLDCNLWQYLKSNENDLTYRDVMTVIRMAASGLHELEKRKIVHKDLAARNVYIRMSVPFAVKVGEIEIGDSEEDDQYSLLALQWMAPEIMRGDPYSNKSDVWSFGVVMWEIFEYGRQPYPEYDFTNANKQMIRKVLHGYRMQQPVNCPDEIFAVISSCWQDDPELRPDFGTLVESLKKIDRKISDEPLYTEKCIAKTEYKSARPVKKH